MSLSQSNLSNPKYGYDMVVATTQGGINTGLKQYLAGANQPETILCFLANELGNPTEQISLDELMDRTEGVNPFDIPNDAPYDNEDIAKLTKVRFVAGVKIKMGLPPGVSPEKIPDIITLGKSANNVGYKLMCSEFTIIQNNPPSGFGGPGSWKVWSQPAGEIWSFDTTVDLMFSNLDAKLDSKYFQNHPDKKEAVINRLKGLSTNTFSLQQLQLNLDTASLQSIPKIEGMDKASNASSILTKSFLDIYFDQVKEYGEPLLGLQAISKEPIPSSITVTDLERSVNQYRDDNGPISNPTAEQKKAATLNYLCASNDHKLPPVTEFGWNWVPQEDQSDYHGTMAINKNTFTTFLNNLFSQSLDKVCAKPTPHVWGDHTEIYFDYNINWDYKTKDGLFTSVSQDASDNDTQKKILTFTYKSEKEDSASHFPSHGKLKITYNASVDIYLMKPGTIKVVTHPVVEIYVEPNAPLIHKTLKIVDYTVTEQYVLSVNSEGNITTAKLDQKLVDDSESLGGFEDFILDMVGTSFIDKIKNAQKDIKSKITGVGLPPGQESYLKNYEDKIDNLLNESNAWVFPGGNTFTFENAQFSDNYDLVCEIRYVDPN